MTIEPCNNGTIDAMDQFLVPQFIEVEDKIFGPVTTRQFIILLVAGLMIFISYKIADFMLFIFLLIVIGALALVIAFVKINGQTFHYFLLNVIQTTKNPSRRIWRKDYPKKELQKLLKLGNQEKIIETVKETKRLSYNRLRDLTLTVNTGGYYKPEQNY